MHRNAHRGQEKADKRGTGAILPLSGMPCSDGCRENNSWYSLISMSRLGTGVPMEDQQELVLIAMGFIPT